ncbi:hypothetical protein [Mycolicibacterium agri]|nr:hypothetical protein [Mycolicibacterium agri]
MSTLHRRLKKAHSKIRELEARQADLLARLNALDDADRPANKEPVDA